MNRLKSLSSGKSHVYRWAQQATVLWKPSMKSMVVVVKRNTLPDWRACATGWCVLSPVSFEGYRFWDRVVYLISGQTQDVVPTVPKGRSCSKRSWCAKQSMQRIWWIFRGHLNIVALEPIKSLFVWLLNTLRWVLRNCGLIFEARTQKKSKSIDSIVKK